MIPGTILLSGVVGSTAYGLDTADSDVDRLGLFAAPTVAFHGLHRPQESHVTIHPDATYHEAAKWIRLALGGNPTVTELVWLDQYEVTTPLHALGLGYRLVLEGAPRRPCGVLPGHPAGWDAVVGEVAQRAREFPVSRCRSHPAPSLLVPGRA